MELHTPVPYAATAHDLANLFTFLASDDSRMINGQLLRVDGGLLSKMPYFEAYRDATQQAG
jgi:NAD(P)-dependent dehydrogenase (short-subunit alcohol dehydrogenase family)